MAGSTFNVIGDRTTYRLGCKGYIPGYAECPERAGDPETIQADNTPFTGSPVIVYPTYPVSCGTGAMPTWLVRGTRPNPPGTEIESALCTRSVHPRDSEVHEGQSSIPSRCGSKRSSALPTDAHHTGIGDSHRSWRRCQRRHPSACSELRSHVPRLLRTARAPARKREPGRRECGGRTR